MLSKRNYIMNKPEQKHDKCDNCHRLGLFECAEIGVLALLAMPIAALFFAVSVRIIREIA